MFHPTRKWFSVFRCVCVYLCVYDNIKRIDKTTYTAHSDRKVTSTSESSKHHCRHTHMHKHTQNAYTPFQQAKYLYSAAPKSRQSMATISKQPRASSTHFTSNQMAPNLICEMPIWYLAQQQVIDSHWLRWTACFYNVIYGSDLAGSVIGSRAENEVNRTLN